MIRTPSFHESWTSDRSTPGISTKTTISSVLSQTSTFGAQLAARCSGRWNSKYIGSLTLILLLHFKKILQFTHEFLNIFEVEVDGSESHVGHLIQVLQFVHDHLAQRTCGDFAFTGFLDDGFSPVRDG